MEEVKSVRRWPQENLPPSSSLNNNNPVVVQCSTGAGRSGVFVLTEVMLLCLEQNQVIILLCAINSKIAVISVYELVFIFNV